MMTTHETLSPFESRLLDDLHAFQHTLGEPEATLALRPRGGLHLRLALAAATAVALGVGVAFIVEEGARPRVTGTPLSVRYVIRHVLAALTSPTDLILFEQRQIVQTPGQTLDIQDWVDPSTGRSRQLAFDANGALLTETAISYSAGTVRTDIAAYRSKTLTTRSFRASKPQLVAVRTMEHSIRTEIGRGQLKVVGTENLDGQPAIHLVAANEAGSNLWVNRTTYFPIRFRTASAAGRNSTDYEWLPPTAENLAHLDFVAPTGFKHVTEGGSCISKRGGILCNTAVPLQRSKPK
jgi:hypothetical protein